MAQLLLKETFDSFLFIEGEIVTANTYTIDGFIQKKFFEDRVEGAAGNSATVVDNPIPEYSSWKDMREYCFSIIKGKRTPLSFKFIFSLDSAGIADLIASGGIDVKPDEVQGLYLNVKFDGETLICITGTSFKSFSMDKTLERAWDARVQEFFEEHGIEYAKME